MALLLTQHLFKFSVYFVYHSFVKKINFVFLQYQVDSENIMLGEMSDKYCIISFICRMLNTNEYVYAKLKQTHKYRTQTSGYHSDRAN